MLIRNFFSLLCFFLFSSQLLGKLNLKAEQSILIDYHSGAVLFEKNANEKMSPSSMTKIMTAYLIFDALKKGVITLDQTFNVSRKARYQTGSRMFIEQGKPVLIEELIKGTLISSGNDSSVALAEGLAGTEGLFASQMTEKAIELGAVNTQFLNSNGLPLEGHYTTAYDLAQIAISTIKEFPDYYKKYYSLTSYKYNGIEQYNQNTLLKSSSKTNYKVDGMKTGFTDNGGYGLVASGEKNGTRLIVVVNGLKHPRDRIEEARTLLQWGFYQNKTLKLSAKNINIPVQGGDIKYASTSHNKDVFLSYRTKDGLENLKFKIENIKTKSPISVGDHIANIYIEGSLDPKFKIPLYSDIKIKREGFISSMFNKLKHLISPPIKKSEEEILRNIKTALFTKKAPFKKPS